MTIADRRTNDAADANRGQPSWERRGGRFSVAQAPASAATAFSKLQAVETAGAA